VASPSPEVLPSVEAPSSPVPPPPKSRRGLVIGGLAALILSVGAFRVISTWGTEETDNAQVDGHVVVVPSRVAGQVIEVKVQEGAVVKAGDVLAVVDPSDAKVRVAAAEGDLAAATAARDAAQAQLQALTGTTAANLQGASAGVKSAQSGIQGAAEAVNQAEAALEAATARAGQTAQDRQRAEQLLASGGVTKQAYDNALAADTGAQATLAQARAALAGARSNVDAAHARVNQAIASEAQARTGDAQVQGSLAQLRAAEARMTQSQANLDGAKLQLAYTEVKAPFDGVITRRSVEVGQGVAPGTGVFGLVGTSEVWIAANFKETQIGGMKAGQSVDVTIDALPGQHFEGKVEAVTQATGARFALIPPDNASGNFTKVVQRVPVRISLPPAVAGIARPGESAVVTVHVE